MISVSAATGLGMSYPSIIALAQKSGLPNHPGSLYRPGDPLYHGRGWAVDFMGFSQDALATYFMQFDTLEVIHRSRATGKVYGSSNNRLYAPGSNEALLQQHENHLHVAMSPAQTAKALGGATIKVGSLGKSVSVGDLIPNPIEPAAALAEGLGNLFKFFTDPNKWKPVLYLATGVIVIMAAVAIILKGEGNGR